jgi:hypothetical protein
MFGDHPAASDRVPARNATRRPGSGLQSPPRSPCSLFAVPHCLTRAAEVARELLGDGFLGVVITDRPAVDNCFHLRQLGWPHLRRDFQERIDAGDEGERRGAQLQAIGKKMFPHWPRTRENMVTRRMMKAHLFDLAGDLREVFEAGLTAPPAWTVTLCGSLLDRYDPNRALREPRRSCTDQQRRRTVTASRRHLRKAVFRDAERRRQPLR